MSLIAIIIVLALQGLIVGALARLALPGKDPLTVWQTIALAFSVLILYFIRRRHGGGLMTPDDRPGSGGPFGGR